MPAKLTPLPGLPARPLLPAPCRYLAGQGIARQRQAIISGLRESVQAFRDEVTDVNSRDVMELLLITQYFDTLKVSLQKAVWSSRAVQLLSWYP